MIYNIMFKDLSSQNKTIAICDAIVIQYEKYPETELIIDFDNCEFIYPDYALLFICTIKYLERIGCKVVGQILINRESKTAKYLAEMNFFETLKVEFPFHADNIDDKSSVQIQKYTSENQIEVLHSILKVLREKSSMNDNVYASLDYCLNEVLDNVLNHY